ncbi:MAG TPA: thioredoxin family protein [Acidimicrobiia bacterium]|nr:thioredoxin family protein [Acidimicrobiia bacterium]
MILQVVVGVAVVAAGIVVAAVLRRRAPLGPPRDAYPVPRQLVRADFPRPEAPWLVAYFSSETCDSCQTLGPKVAVLEAPDVVACEVELSAARSLHERYEIAAIPMILVADAEGVVLRAFVGATSATDLWAAVAEVREPGSTPESGLGLLA